MKNCCICIPLRDGVTILGFLSLIICILEWVLTTAFKTDAEDGNSINVLRDKGDHIVSLITELANNKFDISVQEINDKAQLLFNCITGESKKLKYLNIVISAGLVLEFEMWKHFDTKQKSKSFTLCNCVWLRLIVWFTLTLSF